MIFLVLVGGQKKRDHNREQVRFIKYKLCPFREQKASVLKNNKDHNKEQVNTISSSTNYV